MRDEQTTYGCSGSIRCSCWWDLFSFLSLHYCFSVFICASYKTIKHQFGYLCARSVRSDSTHVRAFGFLTTPSKTSPSERKRKVKKRNTLQYLCVWVHVYFYVSACDGNRSESSWALCTGIDWRKEEDMHTQTQCVHCYRRTHIVLMLYRRAVYHTVNVAVLRAAAYNVYIC